jgi:TRAP transporter TAXI family solute receptor
VLRLFTISLFLLFFAMRTIQAEDQPKPAGPVPQPARSANGVGTIGIVAGDVDSTGLRIVSDLAKVLDNGNELRVLPIIGKGSYQSINDLLTLRAIDAAIIQSDVMARFQKTTKQPSLQSRMQYVAKLYSEEVHLLSRMQFLCLQDLAGRRVSFGPKDSGTSVTAEAVFEAHAIQVSPLYLDHEDAIERLKRGELDALVYVGGKPARAFESIAHKDKVHFLDVEYVPPLQAAYLPAIVTAEDYPNLVAPNENVGTIGVNTVMVIHNWPSQSERFRVMSRFVERFLANSGKFKSAGFSPKWAEVNVYAPLKGWQRFQPAEAWLTAHAQTKERPATVQAAQQLKTMLQRFVESQSGTNADQEELFNQFVRWYQQQGAPPPRQQ